MGQRDLISEYMEGRKILRKMIRGLNKNIMADREDIRIINSMIKDMDFAIESMQEYDKYSRGEK